jgi:transcriptional regulator with XRE-family HTH domain
MLPHPLSKKANLALITFGKMIKTSRLAHNMSQQELATRLHVSRLTVAAMEKGSAKVSIGTVFEAATIVDIPLLGDDMTQLGANAKTIANICALLPERAGRKKKDLNDEF